ncbi:hypothetical protein L1049_006342 [Liquidambar formosana]|uniref:RRM domain-containing protein n=1 Tax=Liquidambar formosana TaxID=63359 RepID=A0AAP0WTN0_LIQFO
MGETGIVRFPGNLDPRAQEFRPRNPNSHNQLTLYAPPPPPPPQIYYPYTPYPSAGGVGYPPFSSPPAYVSPPGAHPPLPPPPPLPPLPPQSATPSRTLLLSSVPTEASESTVRRELEVFGEVRAVQMERLYDGIVTVHFYDLRHAQRALTEIREQHMQQQSRLRKHYNALLSRNSVCEVENSVAPLPPPAHGLISGRAVWAHFLIPAVAVIPDGHNQGTIVVFNLDSEVSMNSLREIFEAFGPVKELRETPLKRHQKFVEFYDIRDAAKALREMNGKEIHGKHVVIEFSRPGGHGRRFFKSLAATTTAPTTATNNSVVYSTHNCHTRTLRCSPPPPPPPPPPLPRKPSVRSSSNVSPRSYLCQTQSSTKKSTLSKAYRSGNINNKSIKTGAAVEASMGSLCLDGAVENGIEGKNNSNGAIMRRNTKKSNNNSSTSNAKQQPPRSRSMKGRHKNFDSRFLINQDAILESNCRDSRTTVMIKNIPNKYSQKLLLNMLDNHCIHCNEQIADGDDQPLSSYDFVYLPIDFNNKCNVGYGFVNMTSPQATLRLYKAFHLQSWEVFNSRKICEVTYARVQGLEALKEHFKNSKFPSVTEEIFPVVFSPPRDGRQLTEPQPIFGHAIPPPGTTSSSNNHPIIDFTSITKAGDEIDGGLYRPEEDGTLTEAADEMDGPYRLENGAAVCIDDDNDDDDDVVCNSSSSSLNGGDIGDHDESGSSVV